MTPWLAVRGVGLACTDAAGADMNRPHNGAGSEADAAASGLLKPDLDALPELLRAFYNPAPSPALRRVPRYARMGLLAALRAMQAAGWTKDSHTGETGETALIIGSAWGGAQMSMDFMDSLLDDGPRLSSPTAFSHAVNNMGAGLISLLLDLRGACQTVSQFGLSFAGAVQAAALELGLGRARRVLVGALDESDPRFFRACPEAEGFGPAREGSVFLCLERFEPEPAGQADRAERTGRTATPLLRVRWDTPPARDGALFLLSDAARQPQETLCQNRHGQGPLAQALDVCYALTACRATCQNDRSDRTAVQPQTGFVCRCRDAAYDRGADLEVTWKWT